MSEERERLFRDDIGAALERVNRLEEENRELRAEVDRLRAPDPDPPRPMRRPQAAFVAAALSTLLLSSMVVVSAARGHRCHARRAHGPTHQVIPDAPRGALTVGAPQAITIGRTVTPSRPECNPPYVVDGDGRRHYKRACLAE